MRRIIIAIVSIIIALTALWYVYGTYSNAKLTPQEQEMKQAYEAAVEYERKGQEIEDEYNKLLKADTYGGTTPEETLQMYVDALKARDAGLASKYYLPWEQEKALKDMQDWVQDESLEKFITAYENGVVKRGDTVVYEVIYIYDNANDKYPYRIEMELNNINNIWKIRKF